MPATKAGFNICFVWTLPYQWKRKIVNSCNSSSSSSYFFFFVNKMKWFLNVNSSVRLRLADYKIDCRVGQNRYLYIMELYLHDLRKYDRLKLKSLVEL